MRIALVGTLNSVLPTLIGSRSGVLDPLNPQVGHNRYATSTTAAVPTVTPSTIGSRWCQSRVEKRGRVNTVMKGIARTRDRIIASHYATPAAGSFRGFPATQDDRRMRPLQPGACLLTFP